MGDGGRGEGGGGVITNIFVVLAMSCHPKSIYMVENKYNGRLIVIIILPFSKHMHAHRWCACACTCNTM